MGIRNCRKPFLYDIRCSHMPSVWNITMLKSSPPRLIFFILGFSLGLCLVSFFSCQNKPICCNEEILNQIADKLLGPDADNDGGKLDEVDYSESLPPDEETHFKQKMVPFSPVIEEQTQKNISNSAEDLSSQVKVLCWIMTHEQNLPTKASAVRDTWTKRCNLTLFVSDTENKNFPTISINVSSGRENLGEKTLAAFQYIYEHHLHDADWFLKADDDTYVIMENLRYLLSAHNPRKPVYFGHPFRPWVDQGYFSGGSGYVISREALRRFGARPAKACMNSKGGAEDVMFGRCMEFLGVKTGETRDKLGRSRFHAMDAGTHLTGDFPDWYYFYDALHGQSGAESISDYAISFHYVKPKEMHMMEFFIYRLRPYGISTPQQDLNIPNLKPSWA